MFKGLAVVVFGSGAIFAALILLTTFGAAAAISRTGFSPAVVGAGLAGALFVVVGAGISAFGLCAWSDAISLLLVLDRRSRLSSASACRWATS
jgi:hypothetical protein